MLLVIWRTPPFWWAVISVKVLLDMLRELREEISRRLREEEKEANDVPLIENSLQSSHLRRLVTGVVYSLDPVKRESRIEMGDCPNHIEL